MKKRSYKIVVGNDVKIMRRIPTLNRFHSINCIPNTLIKSKNDIQT